MVMAQQPAQVLPSNAPPLRETFIDHASQQRPVLQEHSGNRQQIYHHIAHPHSLNIYDQHKLGSTPISSTLGENAYAIRQPNLQASYYSQPPVYYQRPSWSRGYQDRDADARQRVAEGWQSLYSRFVSCPRYNDYRSRQRKDGKTSTVWPEALEQAFFKALLYWPPMGRRKLMHKDKQRGRNELIADYIETLTRVQRDRKQVSSHIQVLRPFVESDARIMQWLSEEKHEHESGRHHSSYNSSYTNGRLRSTYPGSAQHTHGIVRLPQASEVRQLRSHLDIFQPTEFKLFVRPIVASSGSEIAPLHIYSQSSAEPLGMERHIPDWATFEQEMPLLAKRHGHRPIECNVLAVESSLGMPLAPWQNREEIELAVILNCVGRRLLTAPKVHCSNSFYKNGKPLLHVDQHGSGELQLTRVEGNGENGGAKCETSLKFGSNFWATTLNPLSTLAKSIMTSAQRDAQECARIRKSVDVDMRSITAIQEISIPVQGDSLEPVLVMHWSFSLSEDEVGTTRWRRLHLPQTSSQANARIKTEAGGLAVDTPFDFNAPLDSVTAVPVPQAAYAAQGLQSPFEYDNGSASAQSPTTWATSISTSGSANLGNHQSMPNSATEPLSADASFEMSQGSMMMFDPAAIGVDVLDSAAFNFSVNDNGTTQCSFNAPVSATDQVTDEQAMAYTAASQSWGAPVYAEAYNGNAWQDCGASAGAVNVDAYQHYASSGAAAAAAAAASSHANNDYTAVLDGTQQFANGLFSPHTMADGRQAYAGAMPTVSRNGDRGWPSYTMGRSR